jgi:hypothetical protein
METPEIGQRIASGQSYVVAAGVMHRGRVVGPGVRRSLALNLYDAAHPVSHDPAPPPILAPCK